jgi:O-6-methylguanine DNA methyltransferase
MTAEGITADEPNQAPVTGWGTFEAKSLGTLWLEWSAAGLLRLSFEPLSDALTDQSAVPAVYAEPLSRYFNAEPEDFAEVPLDLHGTDFQLVGQANHVNPIPIIVPCHRVVEAGHHLGGYGGGLERKQLLLELEGVRFHEGVVQPGQMELF